MRIPSRVAFVGAALLAAALLAGCGSTPARAGATVSSAAPVRPDGVQDPAVVPRRDLRWHDAMRESGREPPADRRAAGARSHAGRVRDGADRRARPAPRRASTRTRSCSAYRDPATGQIVGFDIDIARAMAQAIFGDPDKIQFVAITSAQRIPYVQNGTVDLVADTMTINCARLAAGRLLHRLLQRRAERAGAEDLDRHRHRPTSAGKKVCAAAGSTSIASDRGRARRTPIPVVGQRLDRLPGAAAAEPGRRDLDRRHDPARAGRPGPEHEPGRRPVHRRAVRAGDVAEGARPRPVRQRGAGEDAGGRPVGGDLRSAGSAARHRPRPPPQYQD